MFEASDPRRFSGSRRLALECEPLEGRQLLSALSQAVQKLAKETQSLHLSVSSVTASDLKNVAADVQSIAKVATRPSPSTVSALKTEVQSIVAHGSITPSETVVLDQDVSALLTSANIPQSLATQTASDLIAAVTSTGITPAQAKTVLADAKSILTELGTARP